VELACEKAVAFPLVPLLGSGLPTGASAGQWPSHWCLRWARFQAGAMRQL